MRILIKSAYSEPEAQIWGWLPPTPGLRKGKGGMLKKTPGRKLALLSLLALTSLTSFASPKTVTLEVPTMHCVCLPVYGQKGLIMPLFE